MDENLVYKINCMGRINGFPLFLKKNGDILYRPTTYFSYYIPHELDPYIPLKNQGVLSYDEYKKQNYNDVDDCVNEIAQGLSDMPLQEARRLFDDVTRNLNLSGRATEKIKSAVFDELARRSQQRQNFGQGNTSSRRSAPYSERKPFVGRVESTPQHPLLAEIVNFPKVPRYLIPKTYRFASTTYYIFAENHIWRRITVIPETVPIWNGERFSLAITGIDGLQVSEAKKKIGEAEEVFIYVHN